MDLNDIARALRDSPANVARFVSRSLETVGPGGHARALGMLSDDAARVLADVDAFRALPPAAGALPRLRRATVFGRGQPRAEESASPAAPAPAEASPPEGGGAATAPGPSGRLTLRDPAPRPDAWRVRPATPDRSRDPLRLRETPADAGATGDAPGRQSRPRRSRPPLGDRTQAWSAEQVGRLSSEERQIARRMFLDMAAERGTPVERTPLGDLTDLDILRGWRRWQSLNDAGPIARRRRQGPAKGE
jgi:hypothetical protein